MIVKYETCSCRHANEIEKYFINRHDWLENTWQGWSNMGKSDRFYVYILLSERKQLIDNTNCERFKR